MKINYNIQAFIVGSFAVGVYVIVATGIGRLLMGPNTWLQETAAAPIVRYGDFLMWPVIGTFVIIVAVCLFLLIVTIGSELLKDERET